MKEIFLPDGFKFQMEKDEIFKIITPNGYFILKGFPHNFWGNIIEYGDNFGKKWNADGEPLTPDTRRDFDFFIRSKIVYFSSVKQKVEIRKRVLRAYKNMLREEQH